ncbi:precorrin 6A synthase [Methyloceanibacter methanicus]|uniref:Precorrin-6A synthase [deacetylating] n=1 Tax=Methyloceanibacter methanicus TaxID=1774968 RepID=A0A1E3VYB5_9HYPH|nr:precorrin-6A synthase (deacetylating) [Methyloceanibacter methanicus]ODR97906.1 precorrin 6A synthase [Methyloceanibacter methanicus]
MKRNVFVIGIGAGSPDYMTVQAIDALNQVRVFFVPDKGAEKSDLARLRREIIARFAINADYRIVGFDNPVRDSANANYRKGVSDWHDAVEDVYGRLLADQLQEGECGAFLAWGDPSLYDSILRILERLRARGDFELDYEVIPGISSVQALAAAHKIPINRIGEPIMITTGRKLQEGFPDNADSVIVMLDGQAAYKTVDGDMEIFWGAYLGTDDEILVSGRLRDVLDDIERVRREARAKKGWIMDTYLLRKPEGH